MSLSKPKDTFDRFGDDLVEEVLSYLSFEDKFRFECVSKQFLKLIFRKQFDLIIDEQIEPKLGVKNIFGDIAINSMALQLIIKKCYFIKSIKCSDSTKFNIELKLIDVINSFPQYIRHLNCVQFKHVNIKQNYMDLFTKFGPQLKSLKHLNSNYSDISQYLNLCPNLSDVNAFNISNLQNTNQSIVNNLRALTLRQFQNSNSEMFGNLMANNKSLKYFDVYCLDSGTNLFKQISELTQIEDLKIGFNIFDDSSADSLKEIIGKCINLKRFSLEAKTGSSNAQLVAFNSIKGFKNIRTIKLVFNDNNNLNSIWPTNVFSSDSMKNWMNVTHLTLHLDQIFDNLFEDIDKYLPKLQYLNIFDKNANLNNKTIESLAKLPKLKTFILNINSKTIAKTSITESAVNHLIRKCPKIKTIQLLSGFWKHTHQWKWISEQTFQYNDQQIYEIKTN